MASRTFIGRASELAELGQGLDDALAGRGRLLLLVGDPGIGKTRLTDEVAARGARVLRGRCWEGGGAPSYWPWAQVVRSCIRDLAPDALRAALAPHAPLVAQLAAVANGSTGPMAQY